MSTGEGESGGVSIPQPLEVSSYPYVSKDALIGDIAIRLYINNDFNQQANTADVARKAIANAEALVTAMDKLGKKSYYEDLIKPD